MPRLEPVGPARWPESAGWCEGSGVAGALAAAAIAAPESDLIIPLLDTEIASVSQPGEAKHDPFGEIRGLNPKLNPILSEKSEV